MNKFIRANKPKVQQHVIKHHWFLSLLVILCLNISNTSVHAQEELLTFSKSGYEKRYNALIEEIRCLVCQNQNIADSNADLAKDLRNKTYELIELGRSNSDIKQFMRERYGDFVLYEPPLTGNTLLLWFGPLLLLALVALIVFRFIQKQNQLNEASSNEVSS